MIIRPYRGQLVAVRQTEHGDQCGVFARHWGNDDVPSPAPRDRVALGAQEHDNGWLEWDGAPKVDPATGRPYQFNRIPIADHVELEERGIRRAVALDRFAGLLTCLHALRLYGMRYAGVRPLGREPATAAERLQIERFRTNAEQIATRLKDELAADPAGAVWVAEPNLQHSYRLVELWDWLSLVSILGTDRELELGPVILNTTSTGDGTIRLRQIADWTYTLEPYPFDGAPLVTPVPARLIPDRPYETDEDLRAVWRTAELTTLAIGFHRQ